ncbi:MAG: beta strand repeat-containing protein, partial [Phycisphaerales bacterium]
MLARKSLMSSGIDSRSAVFLLVLCAGSVTASSALGQSWLNPVSGNWSDGTKWSGGAAPNSAGATATLGLAAPYTVSLGGGFTIGNLLVTNTQATLNILNNSTLAAGAAAPLDVSVNDGVIVINSPAANNITSIQLNGVHAFTGTGRITLHASSANIDTARFVRGVTDARVINAAGHTINGNGQFNDIGVDNAGTIDASVTGEALQLFNRPVTNTGLMTASVGLLSFNASTVTQSAAGLISATGSGSVQFVNSSLTGGTISSSGAGQLFLPVSVGATFNGVTVASPLNVRNNSTLAVIGAGLVVNAELTINSPGANNLTSLRCDNDGDNFLAGTGIITLNASPANIDTARFVRGAANSVAVIGAGLTVRGFGQFNDIGITNHGIVNANIDGRQLQLLGRASTNNNLMTATSGGTFQVNSHTVTNTGNGRLVADGVGSTVNLISAGVGGGNITAQNGGTAQIAVSTGATLDGVTLSGPFNILNNSLLAVTANGIVNNGVLTVNSPGANNLTSIQANADNTPIAGAGTIVLNASTANIDTARFTRANDTAS